MNVQLAPYAIDNAQSLGRRQPESSPGYRTEFQRDRDRIVHSTAFRRLEYKTQVFVNHEGDLFRTRLTHSIEVAQIGRAIARAMQLNEDLTEAIALAHDLGHTPFGHAGQDALNACMKPYGGFEHNFQSLRVVDKLEEKYAEFNGLNLTFETREGILKHCSQTNAQKIGSLGTRFLENTQPSLEAQLANIADEIAYNNHDVDDGLRAGLIKTEQLCSVPIFEMQWKLVSSTYPDLNPRRAIHETIRRMISALVADLIKTTNLNLSNHKPTNAAAVRALTHPLVSFSPDVASQHHALKRFLRANLYTHYRVHRMTSKAKTILEELFTAFFEDPRLLPEDHYQKAMASGKTGGDTGKARIVSDYIAGMTDRYAIAEHKRLFEPTQQV